MCNRTGRPCNICFCKFIFPFLCTSLIATLNDPFGNQQPRSAIPKRHLNFLLAEPVNRIRLSLELQTTRRRIGQGNLSTFQVSWDMRHDLKPRPEATIDFARPINENRRCPQLFTKPLALKSSPTSNLLFPINANPRSLASSNNRRRATDEAEGSRASARRRQ
jgi:hypothetical protein